MANYTKNVCVGVGGSDMINKSHFLGAAYGMERIMGRTDTPARRVFNYGQDVLLELAEISEIFSHRWFASVCP